MKSLIYPVLFMGASILASAQTTQQGLYLPLEFKKAYARGTRKMDGSVSPSYWQNRSAYKIKAKIDPHRKLLSGEATITYTNNCPDSVHRIAFHVYNDYYKPGSVRAGFFGSANGGQLQTDGMVIEKLEINKQAVDMKDPKRAAYNGTSYTISLEKPLPPKGNLNLKINWHYTIPGKGFERSGAIDSTSMFIGYWYPEIAVLDDIDSWDTILYDAATEFYHDYSDYDIELEAPDNFIVWASVAPDNEQEVYPAAVKERLAKARTSTEPVTIWSPPDFKFKSSKNNLWKYHANNFPDFSFALSNHFVWDAGVYKDVNGEYLINTAYPADHKPFASVLKTISESIRVFHTEFPAYPFPFRYFTIFNGLDGGGMEFPGMANDDVTSGAQMEQWTGMKMTDYQANLGLSMHEMCHMYFPFLMGINEKKYAWMDEGMASFTSWFLKDWPDKEFDQPYLASQSVAPIMVPSYQLKNSGINSYTVGSYSYYSLYRLLGKEEFKKCLKAYMDTWKHKHPTPYDFMFTFNTTSGKDLNWFWKSWYFDWGYMDVAIKEFKNNVLTIENAGGKPIAFNIRTTYSDGTSMTEEINPSVWKASSAFTKKLDGKKTVTLIELQIPTNGDAVKDNNTWKLKTN